MNLTDQLRRAQTHVAVLTAMVMKEFPGRYVPTPEEAQSMLAGMDFMSETWTQIDRQNSQLRHELDQAAKTILMLKGLLQTRDTQIRKLEEELLTRPRMREMLAPSRVMQTEMVERDWGVNIMAEKMGVTRTQVLELLAGITPVDAAWAQRLGIAFGTSAEFWLSLEERYQRGEQ